nr:MAG TPA: hypothetical protein [Caudoviricetes sp.]
MRLQISCNHYIYFCLSHSNILKKIYATSLNNCSINSLPSCVILL